MAVSCSWLYTMVTSEVTMGGHRLKGTGDGSVLSLQLPGNLSLFHNKTCFKNQAVVKVY